LRASSQPAKPAAPSKDEKLRPVSVAEEIERLLDRLVGFAACRCA